MLIYTTKGQSKRTKIFSHYFERVFILSLHPLWCISHQCIYEDHLEPFKMCIKV